MTAAEVISHLKHGLIVSCQSEGEDPFNRPEYMALFARAAEMGGACGIRARQPENVRAVRAAVSLPVIGITNPCRNLSVCLRNVSVWAAICCWMSGQWPMG